MNSNNDEGKLGISVVPNSINLQDIQSHIQDLEQQKPSANYLKVQETIKRIREIKARDIIYSPPVLCHHINPIIHPNTINVIQGQAGTHKSRLLEHICGALLMQEGCPNDTLGFKKTSQDQTFTVLYVDTERNTTEQFPAALQRIQLKAGYPKSAHPDNFGYVSLVEIARQDRFNVLNEFLSELKKETKNPIFIVLDVSTDCIEDFNKTDKSMALIDNMNNTINTHNVIFCCVIHENPGSEKARGHFGTELMNKATTVIQIAFEKDAHKNDLELVRIKYLKCRSAARYKPFYAKYSKEHHDLVLADSNDIAAAAASRELKAPIEGIRDDLKMYLGNGKLISRQELLKLLKSDSGAQDRTLDKRLADIIKCGSIVHNDEGQECVLIKQKNTKDKQTYYSLQARPI
jgi:hypothetical protein